MKEKPPAHSAPRNLDTNEAEEKIDAEMDRAAELLELAKWCKELGLYEPEYDEIENLVNENRIKQARIRLLLILDMLFSEGRTDRKTAETKYTLLGFTGEEASNIRNRVKTQFHLIS